MGWSHNVCVTTEPCYIVYPSVYYHSSITHVVNLPMLFIKLDKCKTNSCTPNGTILTMFWLVRAFFRLSNRCKLISMLISIISKLTTWGIELRSINTWTVLYMLSFCKYIIPTYSTNKLVVISINTFGMRQDVFKNTFPQVVQHKNMYIMHSFLFEDAHITLIFRRFNKVSNHNPCSWKLPGGTSVTLMKSAVPKEPKELKLSM